MFSILLLSKNKGKMEGENPFTPLHFMLGTWYNLQFAVFPAG